MLTDMVTMTHYVDNIVKGKETVLIDLIPPHGKANVGIKNYIYVHKGTVGALVYLNGYFQAHIFHGDKPLGDKYLYCLGGQAQEDDFFTGDQLVHYINFYLDDDESKLTQIYLRPGLLEDINKEIENIKGEEDITADGFIIDGLTPAMHAIIALISDKEVEQTYNQFLRIKRIDPYMTLVFEENGGEVKEKIKISLDAFAIPEENSRYVVNVSMMNLNDLLMFNRVLFKQLSNGDPNSEGMFRVYDAKIIRLLAENSPYSYVLGIIESNNGNFNVNYDAGKYVGYTFKQSFNSRFSYMVVMNKEDPSKGFEAILVVYDDFGQSFTQPLSRENAEVVFKNLVAIRPNLHEDYIDQRTIKDIPARGMTESIIPSDTSSFMEPINDLGAD